MDSLEFFNIGQSAGQNDDVCMLNLKLHSPGIMADGLDNFLGYTLPRLQLQLALMFLLTQSFHLLLRGFNLPRIVSEILVLSLPLSLSLPRFCFPCLGDFL